VAALANGAAMSAVGPEYATTHRLVLLMAQPEAYAHLGSNVGVQPVPVPPSPHGWRLCAATAAAWPVVGIDNKCHVLYTWFWRRAGRARAVAALRGDSRGST
jgi:hypothetical protein